MFTVLLFISLIILCLLGWLFGGKDFLAPSFIFVAGFTVSLGDALTEYNAWVMDLSGMTTMLILLSCIIITSVGIVFSNMPKATVTQNIQNGDFKFPLLVQVFLLLLQIAVYLLVYRKVSEIVLSYSGYISPDRNGVIGAYDELAKYSNVDTSLGAFLTLAFLACNSIPGILAYCLIKNYFNDKRLGHRFKFNLGYVFVVINVLLGIAGTLITGGRAGLVWNVVSIAVSYFLIRRQYFSSGFFSIKVRNVVLSLVLLLVGFLGFFNAMKLVGRSTTSFSSPLYNLNVYLGAPVKNLDSFLGFSDGSNRNHGPFGYESFKSIYSLFGIDAIDSGLPTEHQYINNYWLGNVYTALGSLYYDFGFWGSLIVLLLIIILYNYFYHRVLLSNDNARRTFWTLLYSYAIRGVLFVFFANLFSSTIISSGFITRIFLWYLTTFLLYRYFFSVSD